MEKKDYLKPSINIVEMDMQATILAGSGEQTVTVEIDESDSDYDGAFYAPTKKTLWDDSDE